MCACVCVRVCVNTAASLTHTHTPLANKHTPHAEFRKDAHAYVCVSFIDVWTDSAPR